MAPQQRLSPLPPTNATKSHDGPPPLPSIHKLEYIQPSLLYTPSIPHKLDRTPPPPLFPKHSPKNPEETTRPIPQMGAYLVLAEAVALATHDLGPAFAVAGAPGIPVPPPPPAAGAAVRVLWGLALSSTAQACFP